MSAIPLGSTIGIIGGGQLGRMTAQAAKELGYKAHIYCPDENSPASQVADESTIASYEDKEALAKFAAAVDVITFEFENIPNESVIFLESLNAPVRPGSLPLYIAQNRIREKTFCSEKAGVPVTEFAIVKNYDDLLRARENLNFNKAILKTTELGYDGKGQAVITDDTDLKEAWEKLRTKEAILEDFVPFEKEISVVVARNLEGEMLAYPPGENVHVNGILDTTEVPALISSKTEKDAIAHAKNLAEKLGIIGLLAVEFFVRKDGEVLANEIAPRPHNSGHWTMDAADTSQFEQLIRAICGLPMGSVRRHSKVKMKNLIGSDIEKIEELSADPEARIHVYGKKDARPGRKMAHVNYITPAL